MVELKVRRLTLSSSLLLCPLHGRAALQSEIRDGHVCRCDVALEKYVKVPVEFHLEREKHVYHQVEQEPALQNVMRCHRRVTRNLSKKLTVELVLKGRMLQAGVNEMLDGTEVVLERHRLHRGGEVELKVLKEILGLCVEGAGREGGESLVKASGGPVENRVFPVWAVTRVDGLVLHDLSEDFLHGRQLKLVSSTLRDTQVVEPLLLEG